MSIDYNCVNLLNFGSLWERSKCAESPIYQLFLYLLFWTSISEIKSRPYFSFLWKTGYTKFKKSYAILVSGHVDIVWTYKGAKIKMILACLCRFKYIDFDFFSRCYIDWFSFFSMYITMEYVCITYKYYKTHTNLKNFLYWMPTGMYFQW